MFTGIVEELGRVAAFEPLSNGGARLRVNCSRVIEDAYPGSSIAVNGVCLTALDPGNGAFRADLAPETVSLTNLGDLAVGSPVNLERPLAAGGRLSGHVVQGHVDGAGELISLETIGEGNWWLRVRVPAALDRYLVYKGSVALDGISLTVARAEAQGLIAVTIIPHTYEHTNIHARKPGDRINVECDILAKYVEKLTGR